MLLAGGGVERKNNMNENVKFYITVKDDITGEVFHEGVYGSMDYALDKYYSWERSKTCAHDVLNLGKGYCEDCDREDKEEDAGSEF